MRRIGGLLCFDLLQHRAADLLVRGEDRLAPEFDALGFGISPAARGRSKVRRRSSFAATPRMAKTISVKSEVVSRNGSASDRIPAPARCISRAITKRWVVSRERRSTAGVITTSCHRGALSAAPDQERNVARCAARRDGWGRAGAMASPGFSVNADVLEFPVIVSLLPLAFVLATRKDD
jgi:hypothetical protein